MQTLVIKSERFGDSFPGDDKQWLQISGWNHKFKVYLLYLSATSDALSENQIYGRLYHKSHTILIAMNLEAFKLKLTICTSK